MKQQETAQNSGLLVESSLAQTTDSLSPQSRRNLRSALRVTIRGRSIRLRGLRREPTGLWRWLALLGPGLIAASAGNDAGGIATYSSTGAKYGYQLLWVMLLITFSLGIVQETCARLGAATGRGLLELIRERFGLRWALFAIGVILLANSGLVVSEFIGIGAAMELFGVSRYLAVPLTAALIWYLVVFSSFGRVEKIFLVMTLVFFAYPIAAFLAGPDWGAVARGTFIPTIRRDPAYLTLMVGLMGTTITPYMQLFQQSSVVEKAVSRSRYQAEKIDAWAGAIFSNLMSAFMIIATAATLHRAGKTEIETAADAAKALEPVAGQGASVIFAIGLLAASMLAAAVLPLATSYAVSETFGFAKGVNLDFRRAHVFFSLFTVLILLGAGVALIPGLPMIQLLLGIQVLNGALLPVMLVFILRLANDERLTRELKNTRLQNLIGWGTLVMVTTAVVVMFVFQAMEWFKK
jgi:Mn2+/Fe2+ NRAMP family transporter